MTFERIKNLFFAAAMVAVAFYVIIPNALYAIDINVPVLKVGESFSQLEGRAYTSKPNISLSAVTAGIFQDTCEKYLSDIVPSRGCIILMNAKLQRSSIVAANTLFGYDVYHTRYGSAYVATNKGAVYRQVRPSTEKHIEAAHSLTDAINAIAKTYPDITFIYNVIDDTYTSDTNPTASRITKHMDSAWIDEHLISRLNSNITVYYDVITSERALYSDWFLTEHHWKLSRALETYNGIGKLLGWKPVAYKNDFEVVPEWTGASARNGLDLDFHDSLRDLPTDFSFLECRTDSNESTPIDRGERDKIMRGEKAEVNLTNAYHSYFGRPKAYTYWTNTKTDTQKTCLLIAQSYGCVLEPYIAQNYRMTICVNPLSFEINESLETLINRLNPNDVIIQLNTCDLTSLTTRSPSFCKVS